MSQVEQADMFPELLPDLVVRFWKAIAAFYAYHAKRHAPPSRRELARFAQTHHEYGYSDSALTRARRDPKLRVLLPWPVRRNQQPPWLIFPELYTEYSVRGNLALAAQSITDGEPLRLMTLDGAPLDVVVEPNGVIRLAAWLRDTTSSVVVVIALTTLLDLATDHQLDLALDWCARIFGASFEHL